MLQRTTQTEGNQMRNANHPKRDLPPLMWEPIPQPEVTILNPLTAWAEFEAARKAWEIAKPGWVDTAPMVMEIEA